MNPSLDISQYAHQAWTVRDGFFKGPILAIAQTPDGYLWLGTEFGLLRFDGVRFIPWTPPAGASLPDNYVDSLLVARDGRLWIGTRRGLASWKDGKLLQYAELAGKGVATLLADHQDTVWVGSVDPSGRLCAIRNGRVQCYGQDGRFGHYVADVYQDGDSIWVGAETGLWRWSPEPSKAYPLPFPGIAHWQALSKTDDGSFLIVGAGRLYQLRKEKLEKYSAPGTDSGVRVNGLLRDRDGGTWAYTRGRGLMHFHPQRTDRFTQLDGLSGDIVETLFEDREGSVWAGTTEGLDRFRDLAVPAVSTKQGLSTGYAASVLAASDGDIWIGTEGGLNRWRNGEVTVYRESSGLRGTPESLFEDKQGRIWVSTMRGTARLEGGRFVPVSTVPGGQTHFIASDLADGLWFAHDENILHWVEGRITESIGPADPAHPAGPMDMAVDLVGGAEWIGFYPAGLSHVKDDRVVESWTRANGLGEGTVAGVYLDPEGVVWAATEGGLSRVKDGRVDTLTTKNGLPCDAVHWAKEDDNHAFWLYTACGLVRIARRDLESWAVDPGRAVSTTVLDSSDGIPLRGIWASGYGPRVSKAKDGKLWFVTGAGVSVLDPRNLRLNKVPPPVAIERVKADGKVHEASRGLHLPALVRDVWIDYNALSFAAPEKNHFRYKLEGQDNDWKEVVNAREAQYSNLPPRRYTFRVLASNNNGVWSDAGASLDFFVDPAYYQTWWFRALAAAAFLAIVAGLYLLRVHHLARQFDIRMQERVNERLRIARDLHDTLLQSFQGVLLKFSAALFSLPDSAAESRDKFEGIIEQARDAISEGRNAVQGLRSSTLISNDLAQSIGLCGDGLARELGGSEQVAEHAVSFRMSVEGESRDLPPLVRDEIYRIAVEALRNAFRHSEATAIEVELRYDPRRFTMLVRDDGKGIDPHVLKAGMREGHHGLPGMQERASLTGGSLVVWSQPGAGTEIELTIPAAIAYRKVTASGRGAG